MLPKVSLVRGVICSVLQIMPAVNTVDSIDDGHGAIAAQPLSEVRPDS